MTGPKTVPPEALEASARINDRYELDMDFDSVPELCERFGLTFPGL